MKYQQDLHIAVREQFRRLMTASHTTSSHEVRLVVAWINKQPALLGLLAEAGREEPDVDAQYETFTQGLGPAEQFSWPSNTEEGRATLVWRLMQEVAEQDKTNPNYGWQLASGYSRGDLADSWREFTEDILQHLFNYLGDRIGSQSSVLHTLERYKWRTEWFDRESLYARFLENKGSGEDVYVLDLQRFLFLEGDYVVAKPRSASGEADLVGDLSTSDPLVCDGKIFGPQTSKTYIAKGFHQIIQYAHDYNKHVGYLVIYNVTDKLLEFPTDGASEAWPPYVEMSGVRVYFVAIRALPPATTASKAGKAKPVVITHKDLTDPDAISQENSTS
ncbi:hypothetical protein [Streptomyces sp. NPDC048419]|uniref:hypothetical protein n=1 Tax=Streptomyces sp. NPDC048419 TaxID=3365547 RepID=UPI00370F9BE7